MGATVHNTRCSGPPVGWTLLYALRTGPSHLPLCLAGAPSGAGGGDKAALKPQVDDLPDNWGRGRRFTSCLRRKQSDGALEQQGGGD
ncbi:unnamed protein product [Arctogadus glacialis]